MMCIDWDNAGVDLYGSESSGNFAEMDIAIVPCNVKLTPLGALDDRIGPECDKNLTR